MQPRAQRTRESLLRAAATYFERLGYVGTRLEDVVTDAGATKGALYFHFPSKAELAVAVVTEHRARWKALIEEVEHRELPTVEQLHALAIAVAQDYQDDPIARAGVRLGNEYRFIEGELPRPFVDWIAYVTRVLTRGRDRREINAEIDCAAAARVIVGSFFGVQEVSARLHDRADLLDRVSEWWTLLEPALRPSSM